MYPATSQDTTPAALERPGRYDDRLPTPGELEDVFRVIRKGSHGLIPRHKLMEVLRSVCAGVAHPEGRGDPNLQRALDRFFGQEDPISISNPATTALDLIAELQRQFPRQDARRYPIWD
jgi:hypothetical protein